MARRKPTRLKIIAGNPGKRRLPPDDPPPEPMRDLDPPKDLRGAVARRLWNETVKLLARDGLLAASDRVPLAAYCDLYARHRQTQTDRDKAGRNSVTGLALGRLLNTMDRNLIVMRKSLGLTPESRGTILPVPQQQGASDWDDLDKPRATRPNPAPRPGFGSDEWDDLDRPRTVRPNPANNGEDDGQ